MMRIMMILLIMKNDKNLIFKKIQLMNKHKNSMKAVM